MKHTAIIFAVLLLTGCLGQKKQNIEPVPRTVTHEQVIDDMVSINEISECEKIIEDSSLMNGNGKRAWMQKGRYIIRIKNGDKYYLRMTTEDGYTTAVTYRYEK